MVLLTCPQHCASWHLWGFCGKWILFLTTEWNCTDSYKRRKLWEETSEDKQHRGLGVIGETCRLAKDKVLRKVFGRFAKHFRSGHLKNQKGCDHETYHLSLGPSVQKCSPKIWNPTDRWGFLHSAQHLRKCARDFAGVKRAANDFVEWASGILEKQQDSELAQDVPNAKAYIDYKINIHKVILDNVVEIIYSCYAENAVLCTYFWRHILFLGIKTFSRESDYIYNSLVYICIMS